MHNKSKTVAEKTNPDFQAISTLEYQSMLGRSRSIEQDFYGTKVAVCEDGTFLKIFRRKRRFSSAMWLPYATRFIKNAQKLQLLRIPCPTVLNAYRCPSKKLDIIRYAPLKGKTVREVVNTPGFDRKILEQLVYFIRELHQKGVYFRSLHFGNIVLIDRSDAYAFGLIDFSDLQVFEAPLSSWRINRNLAHIKRDTLTRTLLDLDSL